MAPKDAPALADLVLYCITDRLIWMYTTPSIRYLGWTKNMGLISRETRYCIPPGAFFS
jgi:hypothetical protein